MMSVAAPGRDDGESTGTDLMKIVEPMDDYFEEIESLEALFPEKESISISELEKILMQPIDEEITQAEKAPLPMPIPKNEIAQTEKLIPDEFEILMSLWPEEDELEKSETGKTSKEISDLFESFMNEPWEVSNLFRPLQDINCKAEEMVVPKGGEEKANTRKRLCPSNRPFKRSQKMKKEF